VDCVVEELIVDVDFDVCECEQWYDYEVCLWVKLIL